MSERKSALRKYVVASPTRGHGRIATLLTELEAKINAEDEKVILALHTPLLGKAIRLSEAASKLLLEVAWERHGATAHDLSRAIREVEEELRDDPG